MNAPARPSYKSTVTACYTANFIGALVINLTPVLFIPLKLMYGLSYTRFGMLLAANYITQVAADIVFSRPTDKFGYRPFTVLAPLLTIAGYIIFAVSPVFLEDPFPGFLAGTIVFSATGGLLELLLSAIVNGIPGDRKARMMSVLHSFYGWGQLTVVLFTTLALHFFGAENWQWIVAAWAVLPLINAIQFSRCELPPQIPAEKRQGASVLLRKRAFYLITAVIIFAGMSEVSMAMWVSAFLDRAVNLPKIIGDTAGMCLGAAMLGTGRLLYGIYGGKRDVTEFMLVGSAAAVACYMTAALSGNPFFALSGCVLCCFATSILWPGSVVLAGRAFPLAGAWLYAMLAAGGDMGASAGPALIGVIADAAASVPAFSGLLVSSGLSPEQFGLRSGLLTGAVFPAATFVLLLIFRRSTRKNGE